MRDATLVFDLDGTLVETAPDLIAATNHVLSLTGLAPISAQFLRPAISHGARHMIMTGLAQHQAARTEAEIDRLLATFLEHYAENIAVSSHAFPGLTTALDQLQSRGARLAVCTNKREGLSRQLLDVLGLSNRFSAIAGRDTFPVFKPHPDHLTGAIDMAGGRIDRAIMIGDSDTDIKTAKAAGIPVIGVTFGYTDVPVTALGADATIDHYDELLPVIERLLGDQRDGSR